MPAQGQAQLDDPVHFVGIGGSGMAGLAELAVRRGLKVQGTDLKDSPILARLRELGCTVSLAHTAEAVAGARTIVYSSAIDQANVELAHAKDKGLALLHRSECLARLMSGHKAVTVAGTHGKSTTSTMIAQVLDALGQDPTAVVGGTMLAYGSALRAGSGEYFVAEADESDGSFLKYRPFVGIITNVDLDHMEFFKNQATLEGTFRNYLQTIDPEGYAVIGWDSPLARQVGGNYTGQRLTYGFLLGSEVRAFDYQHAQGESTFTAIVERDRIAVRLKALGKHNVQNALCSLAVCRALGLDVKKAAAALAEFKGVDRRMTRVAEQPDVLVVDDYAHNPGKIAACVVSLKEAWPDRSLHVVFQPHRYSRLSTMYDDMLGSVRGADVVHVVPVYAAGERTKDDFSPERLARDLARLTGAKAYACNSLDDAVTSVERTLVRPAVVLTVGAGDVWKVAATLKDSL
jgi:UDP-N-acetylmuramate--alanine ligase